jgi:hypothetical protein
VSVASDSAATSLATWPHTWGVTGSYVCHKIMHVSQSPTRVQHHTPHPVQGTNFSGAYCLRYVSSSSYIIYASFQVRLRT